MTKLTIDKIKKIINDSPKGNDEFTLSDISDLHMKCNMNIGMDREKSVYYYEISDDDLLESELTEDDINSLLKKGWRYNNQKKILFKHL